MYICIYTDIHIYIYIYINIYIYMYVCVDVFTISLKTVEKFVYLNRAI